jgi:catechol 2,3-dioxygenase-like lactoylglutathione lyase family enzyme
MTIQRMDHLGIVFDDLASAKAFFVELGLKLQGEGTVEGGCRVVGLEGVRVEFARPRAGGRRRRVAKRGAFGRLA